MEREKYVDTRYTYLILKVHKMGGGGLHALVHPPLDPPVLSYEPVSNYHSSIILYSFFDTSILFCNEKTTQFIKWFSLHIYQSLEKVLIDFVK